MTTPLKLFFSYAHKDEALLDDLRTHLAVFKRLGLIEPWHDRAITGGTEWAGAIDENLEKADVILLLVTPNFIASDYCFDKELARAMERHAAGQARVIPIILTPGEWAGLPFAKLQALPRDAKPVTSWPNKDEAWADVTRGLRRVIDELRAGRAPRS